MTAAAFSACTKKGAAPAMDRKGAAPATPTFGAHMSAAVTRRMPRNSSACLGAELSIHPPPDAHLMSDATCLLYSNRCFLCLGVRIIRVL